MEDRLQKLVVLAKPEEKRVTNVTIVPFKANNQSILQDDLELRFELEQIGLTLKELEKTSKKLQNATRKEKETELADRVDKLIQQFQVQILRASHILTHLKALKVEGTWVASQQIVAARHSKSLVDLMRRADVFQKAAKERWRQKQYHRLELVDPELNSEQSRELVESGQAQAFMEQILIGQRLEKTVQDIDSRHVSILELERNVAEIQQLFRDLATLVDLQSESINVIEDHVCSTKNHVEKGEIEMGDAEKYQKKASKLRCRCLLILVCVLVGVLVPVLKSTVSSS